MAKTANAILAALAALFASKANLSRRAAAGYRFPGRRGQASVNYRAGAGTSKYAPHQGAREKARRVAHG